MLGKREFTRSDDLNESTRQEYEAELNYMKIMLVNKFKTGELSEYSLKRIIKRIEDIAYFNGRLDGEKYKGEEIK